MGENTKIEWAHHTFNPWEGCQKVGPGCDHCYAEARNARFGGGAALNWGPGAPRRRTSASNWRLPIKWDREAGLAAHADTDGSHARPRVFCSSLADVFDNAVDPMWRQDLFELIRITTHLDWLLLTKRIGNVPAMIERDGAIAGNGRWYVPDNVWLGATIVNQAEADRDVPKLLATKANLGVRRVFLSMEPLLGPVDLTILEPGSGILNALTGRSLNMVGDNTPHQGPKLDWIIVGGESGPGARPMHPDWARSLRDQCAAAGVPFLFKQWGEWVNEDQSPEDAVFPGEGRDPFGDGEYWARLGKKAAGRHLDGVQHDGVPA